VRERHVRQLAPASATTLSLLSASLINSSVSCYGAARRLPFPASQDRAGVAASLRARAKTPASGGTPRARRLAAGVHSDAKNSEKKNFFSLFF